MPVMDGYETTKAIRMMDPPQRNVPILALTANATKVDVERCMASGMNDYLPKPFTPDDLYRKLFKDLKITTKDKPKKKADSASKLYNLDYLRSVSGDNEEFIREMVLTFTQTIPPILDEMKTALEHEDWEKLARMAHQIKPSFTLMGLTSMRGNIIFIEENSKNGTRLEELPWTVLDFIRTCQALLPELANEALPA
jgi:CheY-like chemotaxis protein